MANSQQVPTPISFELPSYRNPSEHFRKFIGKLNQVVVPCYASVRNESVTFTISSSDKATLQHSYRKNINLDANKIRASIFASKVNATFSLTPKGEASAKIEIIDKGALGEQEAKQAEEQYGKELVCILRFTVECTTLAAERVLTNFFELLDTHGN